MGSPVQGEEHELGVQPAGAILDHRGRCWPTKAAEEFYLRTTAGPRSKISGILGGKPGLKNTAT